jgi:hypothetical protein
MKLKIVGQQQALSSDQKEELGRFANDVKASFKLSLKRGDGDKEFVEEVEPGDLVEMTLEDGTVWYVEAGELHQFYRGQPLRSQDSATAVVEVMPELLVPVGGQRGIFKLVVALVRIFVLGDVDRGTLQLAKALEEKKSGGVFGLFLVGDGNEGFNIIKLTNQNNKFEAGKPMLLMLHGTAASTKGSFSELLFDKDTNKPSKHWQSIRAAYGNRVVSFEHRSLTESPFQNLKLLAEKLTKDLPAVEEYHLLSQSRGGQVGELLICCLQVPGFAEKGVAMLRAMDEDKDANYLEEAAAMLSGRKIRLTKFVRVCCPAAGTNFLGSRLEQGLNTIFNLANKKSFWLLDGLLDRWRELVIAVSKHRNDPKVLPGLYCQTTYSHTVRLLNSTQFQTTSQGNGVETVSTLQFDHNLCVVQGNSLIDPKKSNPFRVHIFETLQDVFRSDNDFVVDTDSMTKGLPRRDKGYYLHIENTAVHHLDYYKDPKVQQAIAEALLTPNSVPSIFEKIDYSAGAQNRGDLVDLPDGSLSNAEPPKGDKPIVVLLPGIMGSNLSKKEEEIWVNYGRIFLGDLDKLKINATDISANSVIKDAYGFLYLYLKKKGFDVVVFPYDWRRSIAEASKLLNTKLDELRNAHDQSIHLIAHSMGGLVVRAMMAMEGSIWGKLKDHAGGSHCLLLGTPWKGSYLIPQVITGFGRTINAISMLDFKHTKLELLEQFVKYPGLLELLPYSTRPEHDFFKEKIWEAFEKSNKNNAWALPTNAALKAAEAQSKLADREYDFSNIIYVAGQSDRTVNNVMLQNRYGHKLPFNARNIENPPDGHKLVFTATSKGDGSVTWDAGIPKKLKDAYRKNLYFVNTEHGELANDPRNFPGFLELLQKGSTSFLSNNEPVTRGADEVALPAAEPLPNTSEGLLRAVLGLTTAPNYLQRTVAPATNINVSVMTGHLKHAAYPLLVGHFEGDAIVSAEQVVDIHLDHALSARQRLGLYPGAIGSSLLLLNGETGAVVVGLGSKEILTQYELTKTIKMGCIKYILTKQSSENKPELNQIGLSALMVGTGYGNLSMNSSLSAIVEAVALANRDILETMGQDYPQITSIEIVELYRDKAEQAYVKLNNLSGKRLYPFRLAGPIRYADGSRNLLDLDEGQDWWSRIMAVAKEIDGKKGFYITANSGTSNVPAKNSLVNPSKIGRLLNEAIEQPVWNIRLASAMFGLFVPKEFQQTFRSQQNILWILDKTTAKYPLELLHYDTKPSEPMAVKSGMIRQLSTHYGNMMNIYSEGFKALVIGDPKLDEEGGIAQLPGAAKEAETVGQMLSQFGYDTTVLLHSTSSEVFMNLFEGYRILHIASHGVVEFGEDKETGILISDGAINTVITTAEINQITPIPDLVFINCCYLGQIDEKQERHFREKYQLAANIGTQFIENGVKAVVVAGWPVDDNAALLFAEQFYNCMLSGKNFGEAVQKARKDCYDAYGNTNTWGAYQCYGDPFFQLTRNGASNGGAFANSQFLLSKEAIIALEKWMVKAKSDNYYSIERLRESLNEIYDKIQSADLGADAVVLEQLAYCYAEIGQLEDVEKAIGLLLQLMKMENASYPLKVVDIYFALMGKKAMLMPGNGNGIVKIRGVGSKTDNNGKDSDPFEPLLQIMDSNKGFREATYSRRCLLGDTYRRKAIWMNKAGDFAKVLNDMQIAYNDAFVLSNGMPRSEKFYAIYHWVLATCAVCTDEKFFKDKLRHIKGVLGLNFTDFLTEQENIINAKKTKLGVQDYLQRAKITECRLLFLPKKDDHDAAVKSIIADLKNAFKIIGSPKSKAEQLERLKFVQLYVTDICLQHYDVYRESIDKLVGFLEKT